MTGVPCCNPTCERVVDPRHAWREVQGWVSPATEGAKNFKQDDATGRYMCAGCFALHKDGMALGQGRLGVGV